LYWVSPHQHNQVRSYLIIFELFRSAYGSQSVQEHPARPSRLLTGLVSFFSWNTFSISDEVVPTGRAVLLLISEAVNKIIAILVRQLRVEMLCSQQRIEAVIVIAFSEQRHTPLQRRSK
jgi:hypothetical protein